MSSLQTMNTNNKAAEWAQQIAACRSSGLSVTIWCKENGLCEQTYHKWQKNFLFANTPKGAAGSAAMFSLIQTALENGMDPYKYLTWLLRKAKDLDLADEQTIQTLLPWNAPDECKSK